MLLILAIVQSDGWVRQLEAPVDQNLTMTVRAATRLPDGAVVTLRVTPVREAFDEPEARLAPVGDGETPQSRRVTTRGGVVEHAFTLPRAGTTEVVLTFDSEQQKAAVRQAAGAGPFAEYRAVVGTAPLGKTRRDSARAAEWIRSARQAVEADPRGGAALAGELKRLREKKIAPEADATLMEASSALLIAAIVRYVLSLREIPAPSGDDGRMHSSWVPDNEKAMAELSAALERCDEIRVRETILWHLKRARELMPRAAAGRLGGSAEELGASFNDIDAPQEFRQGFEEILAGIRAVAEAAEELRPELIEALAATMNAFETQARALEK